MHFGNCTIYSYTFSMADKGQNEHTATFSEPHAILCNVTFMAGVNVCIMAKRNIILRAANVSESKPKHYWEKLFIMA